MKQPADLTPAELEVIVLKVRDVLWQDSISGELDPDQDWDSETIEWVSGVLEEAGVKPDRVAHDQPSGEGAPSSEADEVDDPRVGAMVAALEAFVGTIEATGGCVRLRGEGGAGEGSESLAFGDGLPVPVGDESWIDLGSAYLLACRALGRGPMVRDEDDDRSDEDDEDEVET